jgi:hypothetical protein
MSGGIRVVTEAAQEASPWFTMWIRPRSTIQRLIDIDGDPRILLLAGLAGIADVLNTATLRSQGDKMSLAGILGIALIAGPVKGIIQLYIGGFLLRLTGRWIGGKADSETIRAALAWGSVPIVWSLLLLPPELVIFGKEIFTSATPGIDSSMALALAMIGFGLVEATVGIWCFVVIVKGLSEVQRFSSWKAVANIILSGLVIVVPILVIVLLVYVAAS